MAEEFTFSCDCGYRSAVLSTAPRSQPIMCDECNSIVCGMRNLFRFDYAPCPGCGTALSESATLGKGWFVTGKPSTVLCPRCKQCLLTIHPIAHLDFGPGQDFPKQGQRIHAILCKRGIVTVPDVNTEHASVWFSKTPSLPVGTRIEALVLFAKTRQDGASRERVLIELMLDYQSTVEFK
jgi:hypothetical protein